MLKIHSLVAFAMVLVAGFIGATHGQDPAPAALPTIVAAEGWTNSRVVELNNLNDPDGSKVTWDVVTFFAHKDPHWEKTVHVIFGETVMRAFDINDESGKTLERWIQLEHNGKWYTAKADALERGLMLDPQTRRIVGIVLLLRDADGKEIIRRTVMRKDRWR